MRRTAPAWLIRKFKNIVGDRLLPLKTTEADGLKFRFLRGEPPPQNPRDYASKGFEFHGRIANLGGNEAIDVAANIGSYTLRLAKMFKSVTAFEPNPIPCRVLRRNIALNNLRNL